MDPKFTPGPWRVGYQMLRCKMDHYPHGQGQCRYEDDGWSNYLGAISTEGGTYVAYSADDFTPRAEDAALIAAAPELWHALWVALECLKDEPREMALDALKKALKVPAPAKETV